MPIKAKHNDTETGAQRELIGGRKIDRVDRRLLGLIQGNPGLTQVELAKALGISQSSTALRLAKLKKINLLVETDVINYEQLGLSMCRVEVETSEPSILLDWCRKCPLFVNAARSVGSVKINLFFLAEDLKTFHSIIDEHLSKLSGIRNYEMSLFDSWEITYLLKLDLQYSNQTNPPCGMLPFCSKCPMNANYDGRIWNNNRLFREIPSRKATNNNENLIATPVTK